MQIAEGTLLRVDFDRALDRWKHRISLVLPEKSGVVSPLLLLESVEGTSQEDWPVSPPLQFVSIEPRPKKPPVALLMGMAGGSHWSASIEQYPAERFLRFDIACRAKSRPEKLGSRYRIAPRVHCQTPGDDATPSRLSAGGLTFELSGETNEEAPSSLIQAAEQELYIHFGAPVISEPQTYRWVYQLKAINVSA
jgi:hypothetical protein